MTRYVVYATIIKKCLLKGEKTVDLRVKRTKKNIKDAFLELRKKKSIERISVKELSETAMINKATFYLHYKDIYDLSESLQDELIEKILSKIKGAEISDDPSIAQILSEEIQSEKENIKILFSDFGDNRFINHLEDSIKEYVFETSSRFRDTPEDNILLSFLIQGSYHAHIRNNKQSEETLRQTTSDIFYKLLN